MSQVPLSLLCIEPRFPGRLGAIADWLVRKRGYRCQFYYNSADARPRWPAAVGRGLEPVPFGVGGVAREPLVPWKRHLERGLCYAYGCWEVLDARRPRPIDLVLGRSAGLGSTLFFPVYQSGIPIVNLLDYYYHASAHDLAGEAGSDMPDEYYHWRQAANAMDLLDLENGVVAWTLTNWQRDLFPLEYRHDIRVLHDGVNTRRFARRAGPRVVAGRAIPAGTRVVSFVAQALDQLRGFDRFMELANRLVRARPDVLCVVAGAAIVQRTLDVRFYNQDYRAHVFQQRPPADPERFWFLDTVTQETLAELLAASDLHVYPSRPYIVARSLLEALSAGCVVLAADTASVREILTPGVTGLVAQAADADAWERQARAVLDDPAGHSSLGEAAAAMIRARYDQDRNLAALADWFGQLVEKGR